MNWTPVDYIAFGIYMSNIDTQHCYDCNPYKCDLPTGDDPVICKRNIQSLIRRFTKDIDNPIGLDTCTIDDSYEIAKKIFKAINELRKQDGKDYNRLDED